MQLVGGHPAVDLVNTVSWRLDPARTVDRLAGPEDLLRWLRSADLLDTESLPPEPGAERNLSAVRRLREAVHGLFVSFVEGAPPSTEDLSTTRQAIVDARRHATLRPALPLRWSIRPRRLADVPRLLALAADDLLSAGPLLQTLGRCEGAGCGWFFLDTSRSHTRRWCSTADCGNRERVRRHYARHRVT